MNCWAGDNGWRYWLTGGRRLSSGRVGTKAAVERAFTAG
jgi:hypothetical protein